MNDNDIIEWIAEHLVNLTCNMNDSITITFVDSEGYHQIHVENQAVDETVIAATLLRRAITKITGN